MLPLLRSSRRRGAVCDADWRDWRWQLRHRLTRADELEEWVRLSDEERHGLRVAPGLFRVGTTPYYAELMDAERADCPVRRQVIPVAAEARVSPGEYVDPLGEDARMPAPAI